MAETERERMLTTTSLMQIRRQINWRTQTSVFSFVVIL